MLEKYAHLKRIADTGIEAVIRAETREQALRTVAAVMAGGIGAVEITLTVPGAVALIEELVGSCSSGRERSSTAKRRGPACWPAPSSSSAPGSIRIPCGSASATKRSSSRE